MLPSPFSHCIFSAAHILLLLVIEISLVPLLEASFFPVLLSVSFEACVSGDLDLFPFTPYTRTLSAP